MLRELLDNYTDAEFTRGTDALMADIENAGSHDQREGAFTSTLGIPAYGYEADGLPPIQSDMDM